MQVLKKRGRVRKKECSKDGNGKGDEGKGICMDGWYIYIKSGRDALSLVDVSQSKFGV